MLILIIVKYVMREMCPASAFKLTALIPATAQDTEIVRNSNQ